MLGFGRITIPENQHAYTCQAFPAIHTPRWVSAMGHYLALKLKMDFQVMYVIVVYLPYLEN